MLLRDISEEERADAMAFYRSYFEDAGEGNEARVLEELGSPENVAEIIKRDLGKESYTMYHESENLSYSEKKDNNTVIWVIIIAVLTSPLWIGFVTGVFGTILGLSVALIACTFAMFVVGIAFVGVGMPMLVGISGAAGLALIGAGLLVLAIAILMINACVWIFGKLFPWAVNSVIALCKKLLGKDKEAKAV